MTCPGSRSSTPTTSASPSCQGLAGSFGVVLSVPVTVALAMLLYVRPDRETPALQEQEQA